MELKKKFWDCLCIFMQYDRMTIVITTLPLYTLHVTVCSSCLTISACMEDRFVYAVCNSSSTAIHAISLKVIAMFNQ